jgi:hypothetical protein
MSRFPVANDTLGGRLARVHVTTLFEAAAGRSRALRVRYRQQRGEPNSASLAPRRNVAVPHLDEARAGGEVSSITPSAPNG